MDFSRRSITPTPAMMGVNNPMMNGHGGNGNHHFSNGGLGNGMGSHQQFPTGSSNIAGHMMPPDWGSPLFHGATEGKVEAFVASSSGMQMLLRDAYGHRVIAPMIINANSLPASIAGSSVGSSLGGIRPTSTLGRPNEETLRRRREASISLMDEMDGGGAGPRSGPMRNGRHNYLGDRIQPPLADRISPRQNGDAWGNGTGNGNMGNGWSEMNNRNGGGPYQNGFSDNDGFARPSSRMSQRGGMERPNFRPYSVNSVRSNGTGLNGNTRPSRDSYYPIYKKDGHSVGRDRIPPEEKRPFYTPAPKGEVAGILVKNLSHGTTVQDAQVCFAEFAPVQSCEIVDRSSDGTFSVLVVYSDKDDADRATQALHGISADGLILQVLNVNPRMIDRPNKDSSDPELRIGYLPKQIKQKDAPDSLPAERAGSVVMADRDQNMVEQTPS